MTKRSRQKFKYLENKKAFIFFIILKVLSVAKSCHRSESAPFQLLTAFAKRSILIIRQNSEYASEKLV